MFRQHRCRIAAAEGAVPGIEQQMRGGPGRGHEGVDILGTFDHGAHVMVIGQRDAPGRQIGGSAPILAPKAAISTVLSCGRSFTGTSGRPCTVFEHSQTMQTLQSFAFSLARCGWTAAISSTERVSSSVEYQPRDEAQTMAAQQRLQRARVVRPAMAVLDPVKADDLARLVQDLFEVG